MTSTESGSKIRGPVLAILVLVAGVIGYTLGFKTGYDSGSDEASLLFKVLEGYRDLIEEPTPRQVIVFMVVNGSEPVIGARVEVERHLAQSDTPAMVYVKRTNSLGIAVFQIRERDWDVSEVNYSVYLPEPHGKIGSSIHAETTEDWIFIRLDVGMVWA